MQFNIVGGGAAGAYLCALQGKDKDIDNILIIEKDPMLGMLSSGNCNYYQKMDLLLKAI